MPYTERTAQIWGKAYADSGQVSCTCSIDGVEVHNGVIPTVNATPPAQNITEEALCSFTIPLSTWGTTISHSMTVTGGTVFISNLYTDCSNPDDYAEFNPVNANDPATPEVKTNVRIDGTLIDSVEPEDGFHYRVPDGSTIEIDWFIPTPDPGVPGKHKMSVTSIIAGKQYEIVTPGDTDWTAIGAADNNAGTVFTATGPGTGTGVARR